MKKLIAAILAALWAAGAGAASIGIPIAFTNDVGWDVPLDSTVTAGTHRVGRTWSSNRIIFELDTGFDGTLYACDTSAYAADTCDTVATLDADTTLTLKTARSTFVLVVTTAESGSATSMLRIKGTDGEVAGGDGLTEDEVLAGPLAEAAYPVNLAGGTAGQPVSFQANSSLDVNVPATWDRIEQGIKDRATGNHIVVDDEDDPPFTVVSQAGVAQQTITLANIASFATGTDDWETGNGSHPVEGGIIDSYTGEKWTTDHVQTIDEEFEMGGFMNDELNMFIASNSSGGITTCSDASIPDRGLPAILFLNRATTSDAWEMVDLKRLPGTQCRGRTQEDIDDGTEGQSPFFMTIDGMFYSSYCVHDGHPHDGDFHVITLGSDNVHDVTPGPSGSGVEPVSGIYTLKPDFSGYDGPATYEFTPYITLPSTYLDSYRGNYDPDTHMLWMPTYTQADHGATTAALFQYYFPLGRLVKIHDFTKFHSGNNNIGQYDMRSFDCDWDDGQCWAYSNIDPGNQGCCGAFGMEVITEGNVNYTVGAAGTESVAVGQWVTVTAAVTRTLPPVTGEEQSICYYVQDDSEIVTIEVDGTDVITLDGTDLVGGNTINSSGDASTGGGDFICLFSDGTKWRTVGRSGTWEDGEES